MPFGSGLDGQFGMVKETTYGTFVAPTKFMEIESESLSPNVVQLESRPLARGLYDRTGRHRESVQGGSGDVTVAVLNKGMGYLFEAMLGSVATAQVGVTAEYKHTFTPDTTTGMRGLFYTMQVGRPSADGTVNPFSHLGCKVVGWDLSAGINELLKLTTSVDFAKVVTSEALATASYPASASPYASYDATLTLAGGSAGVVHSVSIRGANAMKTDRYNLSAVKGEPLANNFWEVTGELTGEFESLTAYTAWLAGTETANLIVTYTGTTIPTTSNPFKIVITIPSIKYTGDAPTLRGPDMLEQNRPFKALFDGTNPVIKIEYHTSDVTP